jgi:hypothetical protein
LGALCFSLPLELGPRPGGGSIASSAHLAVVDLWPRMWLADEAPGLPKQGPSVGGARRSREPLGSPPHPTAVIRKSRRGTPARTNPPRYLGEINPAEVLRRGLQDRGGRRGAKPGSPLHLHRLMWEAPSIFIFLGNHWPTLRELGWELGAGSWSWPGCFFGNPWPTLRGNWAGSWGPGAGVGQGFS